MNGRVRIRIWVWRQSWCPASSMWGCFLHSGSILFLLWEQFPLTLTLLSFYYLCATYPVGECLGDANAKWEGWVNSSGKCLSGLLRASHPNLSPGIPRARPQRGCSHSCKCIVTTVTAGRGADTRQFADIISISPYNSSTRWMKWLAQSWCC